MASAPVLSFPRVPPDSLIPIIKFTRKWEACNTEQKIEFLSKFPTVFHKHGALEMLWSTILKQILCQRDTTSSLSTAIHALLPSDAALDLQDTVNVANSNPIKLETVKGGDVVEINSNQNRRTPFTLLRVPTDVQHHMFCFLPVRDVGRLQRVSRALCIIARNPLSIHHLSVYPTRRRTYPFRQRWLSRPKSLTLSHWARPESTHNPLWGHSVQELGLVLHGNHSTSIKFRNLKKCKIFIYCDMYPNLCQTTLASIVASSNSLESLFLRSPNFWSPTTVATLGLFDNLKYLTLLVGGLEHTSTDHSTMAPITLPKLQYLTLSVQNTGCFELFARILIGSNPRTIRLESRSFTVGTIPFIFPSTAFEAIRNVHSLHVLTKRPSILMMKTVRGLLETAHAQCPTQPVIQRIVFTTDNNGQSMFEDMVRMCRCARVKELNWKWEMTGLLLLDESIRMLEAILNAPHGTFTEINIKMEATLSTMHGGDCKPHIVDTIHAFKDAKSMQIFINQSCDSAERWFTVLLKKMDRAKIKSMGLKHVHFTFLYWLGWARAEWEEVADLHGINIEEGGSRDKILNKVEDLLHKEAPSLLLQRLDSYFRHKKDFTTLRKKEGLYEVRLCLSA